MTTNSKESQFFHIPFAVELMGKSVNQVLEQCAAFDPQLFTANRLLEDDYKNFQRLRKLADPSVVGFDPDIDYDKLFFETFDANVGFHCHFELQDYQAFSFVGINFVNNTAVECVVSLGMPANPERYRSELEVTKVFLVSLEELYLNGRIQEESEPGTRVYTWKKDNRTVVSFISYPPSRSPKDTGALLGVQIRDTQLHPQGAYFELLYNRAEDSVQALGKELGDKWNSHAQRVGATPMESIDISPQLKSFCSDYITALGEALDTAIRVHRKEYEAGFDDAMDILSTGWSISGKTAFLFGAVSKKDRPQMLTEIKQLAEVTGIPYNKLSPLNQFIVTIPPYIFYCLEKYFPEEPELKEEARRLIATRGFPRYLQEDLGIPISQKIKGAFWRPTPLRCLARLFGFGRRH